MASDTRTTVYLEPKVHRALKVKAATTDRSVSGLINTAVVLALREDAMTSRERKRFVPNRSREEVGERKELTP